MVDLVFLSVVDWRSEWKLAVDCNKGVWLSRLNYWRSPTNVTREKSDVLPEDRAFSLSFWFDILIKLYVHGWIVHSRINKIAFHCEHFNSFENYPNIGLIITVTQNTQREY